MKDEIISIGNSRIQHGKLNDRIYLMKLDIDNASKIIIRLDELAEEMDYKKIFAKVPEQALDCFLEAGYFKEAMIPRFYHGKTDCYFMGKYLDITRKQPKNKERIDNVIHTAIHKSGKKTGLHKLPYKIRRAEPDDVEQIAAVYKRVFETYPFPIHNPAYLTSTMDNGIIYFGIWDKGKLIGLSSAETYPGDGNAEMTDFAVLPERRGEKLALHLLNKMETELPSLGIQTAYTIARSVSFGMNITFSRNGYHYAGTLFNNTNISGNIESMNVWFKALTP